MLWKIEKRPRVTIGRFANEPDPFAGRNGPGGPLLAKDGWFIVTTIEPHQWKGLVEDWKAALAPHYETAKRKLGVVKNPKFWPTDHMLRDYAREIGREEHFKTTDVGIFFGPPGVEPPAPYSGGKGPARTGCTMTGHCMVGCRDGGKNSLARNYLWSTQRR